MDVERNLNNRPLNYVDAEGGEEEVVTQNTILSGRHVYPVDDTEGADADAEKLTRMTKRLEDANAHGKERGSTPKERGSTPKVEKIVLISWI